MPQEDKEHQANQEIKEKRYVSFNSINREMYSYVLSVYVQNVLVNFINYSRVDLVLQESPETLEIKVQRE